MFSLMTPNPTCVTGVNLGSEFLNKHSSLTNRDVRRFYGRRRDKYPESIYSGVYLYQFLLF